jgi:hypothetical protein
MDLQVYDNFLDEAYFNKIKETFTSHLFPWFMQKGVNEPNDGHRHLVHTFYFDKMINSRFYDSMGPLFRKLNVDRLIRCKANLIPKTAEIVQHGLHRDQNGMDADCMVAIIYINTNNGFTEFDTQLPAIVNSVANRCAIFHNSLLHGGTTCTDEHERIVLNVNYTEKKS